MLSVLTVVLLLGFCLALVLGLLSVLQQLMRTGVHEFMTSDAGARPRERPEPLNFRQGP